MMGLRLAVGILFGILSLPCFSYQLTAVEDRPVVTANITTPTAIPVLANDLTNLDTGWSSVTVAVTVPPTYGAASA